MSFVDHDGASLFYEVEGAGEPLLLITGLGYPSDTWWRVLPWLNERFTTVRLDNRGVGRTGDTAEQPYSIERMAADAVAVMDATIQRAVFIPSSFMIAMVLAKQGTKPVMTITATMVWI